MNPQNLITVLLFTMFQVCLAQMCYASPLHGNQDSTLYYLQRPADFLNKVTDRTEALEAKMIRQSHRYLTRLEKQEGKLKRRLMKTDTAAAKALFGDVEERYRQLREKVATPAQSTGRFRNVYMGHLDSLQTSLRFLEQGQLKQLPELRGKCDKAMVQMGELQGKFNQVHEVKKLLRDRTSFLQSQLSRYGMTAQLRKFQKEVYYYQQQLEEYKNILNDPAKLEATALAAIQKVPAFQQFFNQHSQLGQLFQLPGRRSSGSLSNVVASQSRTAIEQEIRQRLGSGVNINQLAQQQAQPSSSLFNQLKQEAQNTLNSSAGNDAFNIPGFTPNQQKTKSFWKRLEYGTNLQTIRANNYFPVTSDLGLSLGYKLNDKSVLGVGGSYKMGWGKSIRNIAISHQGMGLRSFIDVKLKGSFWISGGGELNYKTPFNDFSILNNFNSWQQSALVGLQKRYKRGKMGGNVQLLYDFLWRQQVPATQPLLFRVGYSLK